MDAIPTTKAGTRYRTSPGNKQVVTFSRNGSATAYQVTDIQTGKSSFVEATMSPVDLTSSISATAGGTITNQADNAYVTIGANSLTTSQGTAYSGTATVMITTFDPSARYVLMVFDVVINSI